jgi:opacity protein-like surface antigen
MRFESKKLKPHARAVLATGALLLATAVASDAQAAGIEDTVGGAIGLGRAAYFVRVNDFMAILQNPANLSVVPGGNLGAELRLPILTSCFDRAKNLLLEQMDKYKRDRDGNAVEGFDQVCNNAFPSPTANIGWARSYNNGIGWGIGLFTPAAVGGAKYGKDTNVTIIPRPMETYPQTVTGMESPTRQLGIERDGIVAHLMLGLGYQPHKMIRFGASAGAGFATIQNKNMVSSTGGTFKDQEILNDLTARDYFIPRATASVVFAPHDSFEIMGAIAYQDDIRGQGHTDLTANGVKGVPLKKCTDAEPGSHCRVSGVKLHVPLPTLEATVGLRYALRRVARERVLDPMKDEKFDIEVNASWAQTSHVDKFDVTLHNKMLGGEGAPRVQMGNDMAANKLPVQPSSQIPKYWKDTWTIRAGTDINIVPEAFSLRLGGSFATSATETGYMNTDYMPVQKIGAHLGATVAVSTYRITLAYAHIFFKTIDVPVGQGLVKDIVVNGQDQALPVNEGRFTGALDVVSLQMNAQF